MEQSAVRRSPTTGRPGSYDNLIPRGNLEVRTWMWANFAVENLAATEKPDPGGHHWLRRAYWNVMPI